MLRRRAVSSGVARSGEGSSGPWPLLAIVFVGFILRLGAVVSFTGAIDPEGSEYARIAENLAAGHGYHGIATPGKQLIFPPLFPFMIAATSIVTDGVELAGRLVSLLMGTLLIVTVFLLARHLYDQATAYVAALLVAVHPYLIGFSSTVYVEMTYATLALTGVYCSFRALRTLDASVFFLAGVFFGLAYLTRPEAALYPVIALGITLTYVFLSDRRALPRVALRSLWQPAAFLALAAPYVVWLYAETGQWRLEGKSPLNYAAGLRMLSGLDAAEAQYGVKSDLTEHGVWIQPNVSIIQAADFSAYELWFYLRGRATEVVKYLIDVTSHTSFGSPPLFFFAMYGLFRRPWRRQLAADHLFLLIVLGISSAALFFIYYMTDRFLLLFVPVLVVWASKGILELGRWGASTMRRPDGGIPRLTRTKFALVLILAAVIPLMALPSAYQMHVANRDSLPVRTAGEWLNAYAPGPKTLVDSLTMLAFHAAATFVPFPHSSSDVALRYLEKRDVNFVVLSDHSIAVSSRPYLREWMEHGVPSARAKLIYSVHEKRGGRIRIYELGSTRRR